MKITHWLVLLVLILLTAPLAQKQTHAQEKPKLAFPVDCTLDEDCWTINYVDTDPSPNSHKDFTCNNKTYEAHKGVDFALRSRIEMEAGIDVLAARDGKVLRLRNGENDTLKTDAEYEAIRAKDRDCGNGIILDHSNGLLTYYCHLKQNSILVKPSDDVTEGQKIAQIGQSGYSEFPHLHFTVIWEGGHIDPFTSAAINDGCGQPQNDMWKDDIPYSPYAVFDGGFRGNVPDFNAIRAGEPVVETLKASDMDAIVYWAGYYHAQKGDEITLIIRDPVGKIIAKRSHVLDQSRKRPSYYYAGRKLNGRVLQPGIYEGSITYKKPGFEPKTFTHSVTIE